MVRFEIWVKVNDRVRVSVRLKVSVGVRVEVSTRFNLVNWITYARSKPV